MPIGFVGPALQGANFIGRVGIPLLQQAGIAVGMAGIGAGVSALTSKRQAKPRQANFTSLSSDQLPAGAYMTEAGRTYGIDSEQVGRLGGYMDERGRVFLPANNRVNPSSWGASPPGRTQPSAPGLRPPTGARPPALSAADRAYEAEKSRVAQLTAQDPELQRYEKAREAAKTQEEMNAARDIGMQIWAQKNPGLAAEVKPGQSGYDVIQGTLAGQAAAQGYGYQMPQQITMTPPPGVNVPQGLPAVQSFGSSETYGSKGLNLDPEIAKKFEELLNQAKQ